MGFLREADFRVPSGFRGILYRDYLMHEEVYEFWEVICKQSVKEER